MTENKLTPREWHALIASLFMAHDLKSEYRQRAGTYGEEGLTSLMQKLGSGEFQRP